MMCHKVVTSCFNAMICVFKYELSDGLKLGLYGSDDGHLPKSDITKLNKLATQCFLSLLPI